LWWLCPPAEITVSALCERILSILTGVFASLFAKSEWVSGQHPEKLKKSIFKKGNKEHNKPKFTYFAV
jgi:hypothetical protein